MSKGKFPLEPVIIPPPFLACETAPLTDMALSLLLPEGNCSDAKM